jgi:hypothetical protein
MTRFDMLSQPIESTKEVASEKRSRSRVVTDEEGHLWRVREISFSDAAPSLIFESETGFRRVRSYPGDWRDLSEQELLELSWRT